MQHFAPQPNVEQPVLWKSGARVTRAACGMLRGSPYVVRWSENICSHGAWAQHTAGILAEMRAAGFVPDVISYNCALGSLATAGRPAADRVRSPETLEVCSVGAIGEAFRQTEILRNFEARLLEEMRRDGVSQNSLFLERHVCYALGMQLDQSKVSGAEELRAQFQELPAQARLAKGRRREGTPAVLWWALLGSNCFHTPGPLEARREALEAIRDSTESTKLVRALRLDSKQQYRTWKPASFDPS